MSTPLSPIVTASGKPFGRAELAQRLQRWLEDARLRKLMLRCAPTSLGELSLIWRDLPRMNERGLARVALWMLKHRLARMAIARVEIQDHLGTRREVKASLTALREWAQEASRPRGEGLILLS